MTTTAATKSKEATVPDGGTGGPRHPEVGVIAVVAEPWGGMWLSRQQILTRLSAWFHVAWVDPPVGWRRLWTGRSGRPIGQADATPPPERGFVVCRQRLAHPKFHRPGALARLTARLHLAAARRELERRGCRRFVLYVWQPKFASALDLVDHDVSCYHIADEYSFSAMETPVTPREHALISRVDQVIVHSPALREKKGSINPSTAYITNGVDYHAFAGPHDVPPDLAGIPHPRIGYIGRIKVQLDWQLLDGLSRRHPEWQFVFVGPEGFLGDSEALAREVFARGNVHALGPKDVTDIPAYTRHMDVCLLSYKIDGYTRYIFPLKLHEYLAAGRPVVGSGIRSLEAFDSVVRIAESEEEWSRAISESLAPGENTAERVEARRRVAREYDWGTLVDRIGETLCGHLGITPETRRKEHQ
jgi:glycosyltransferase involved in cell wall biosynthesis